MPTAFPPAEETRLLLFRYFANLPEPRLKRARRHPLMTILFIIVCATIAGADTFPEMARWAKARESWLRERIDLKNGIPSHYTLGRVFARLSPRAFSDCFEAWTQALHRRTEGEVIAIDGKTIKGSLDQATGNPAVHLISAFAASNRLVLCQEVVEGHENEISAAPELLSKLVSLLDVKDCIVTGDAMFCQKEIAAQVVAEGGNYALALKDNHPHLSESVQEYFTYWLAQDWKTEQDGVPVAHQFAQTLGKGHGRVEIRRCYLVNASDAAPWLDLLPEGDRWAHWAHWAGLKSIAAVVAERTEHGKPTTVHTRYYLTTLCGPSAASTLLRASRGHWGIENRLHWCLDVVLSEDRHQLRGRTNGRAAVRNMALLRKLVLNMLRRGGLASDSLRIKRRMAGWDDDYLDAILTGRVIEPDER